MRSGFPQQLRLSEHCGASHTAKLSAVRNEAEGGLKKALVTPPTDAPGAQLVAQDLDDSLSDWLTVAPEAKGLQNRLKKFVLIGV